MSLSYLDNTDKKALKLIKGILNTICDNMYITNYSTLVIVVGKTIREVKLTKEECMLLKEVLL